MKAILFCFWYFVAMLVDHIQILHFNHEPASDDGLLLYAFILTYCSVSYSGFKESIRL